MQRKLEDLPLMRKVARRSRDGRGEKPKDRNELPIIPKNFRIRRRGAHRAPVLALPYSRILLRIVRRAGSPEPAAAGIFDFSANHVEPRAAARGRALDERPYGVVWRPVRNSRRDVGIAPYANFWLGRNSDPFCVGRAALSPPCRHLQFCCKPHRYTRCGARVRDVEDAVPYSLKSEACTFVGGGVLDAPRLALRFCCKLHRYARCGAEDSFRHGLWPCHLPQRGRQGRCGARGGRSMSAPTALYGGQYGIRGGLTTVHAAKPKPL